MPGLLLLGSAPFKILRVPSNRSNILDCPPKFLRKWRFNNLLLTTNQLSTHLTFFWWVTTLRGLYHNNIAKWIRSICTLQWWQDYFTGVFIYCVRVLICVPCIIFCHSIQFHISPCVPNLKCWSTAPLAGRVNSFSNDASCLSLLLWTSQFCIHHLVITIHPHYVVLKKNYLTSAGWKVMSRV